MKYSPSTKGFYDPEINTVIPEDAIELPTDYYWSLINGQSEGFRIVQDETGYPILDEYPEPTALEILQQEQNIARKYLGDTDWYVIRKLETGKEIPQEIVTKRADARTKLNEVL